MPNEKKDKTISALESVHAALKPLSVEDRLRVLASVNALLEIPSSPIALLKSKAISNAEEATQVSPEPATRRPLAIRELIQDKHPQTHSQYIALFAYYREKYQNLATFSREALRTYYSLSRENPPGNYDRDFVKAVTNGWIHEQGNESYITSKGIEAVESGFTQAIDSVRQRPSKPTKPLRKRARRTR
jgi:hypothetical protein